MFFPNLFDIRESLLPWVVMISAEQLKADYIVGQIASGLTGVKISSFIPFNTNNILQFITLVFGITILLLVIRRILALKQLLKEESVLLELTPPSTTEKSAYTTQQLFSVIHNLGTQSFTDRLLGRKKIFSFEIVSTLNHGIRYLVRTTSDQANNIKRNALSYLPHVKVNVVDEYLPKDFEGLRTEFWRSQHTQGTAV